MGFFYKFFAWVRFFWSKSITNYGLAIFLIVFGTGLTIAGIVLMSSDYPSWINYTYDSPYYRVPMCPTDPENATTYSLVNTSTKVCPTNTTNLFPSSVKINISTVYLATLQRYSVTIYRPLEPNYFLLNMSIKNETGNTTLKANVINMSLPETKPHKTITYPWGTSGCGSANNSAVLLSSSNFEDINSTYNMSCTIVGCNYTLPYALSYEFLCPTANLTKYRIYVDEHGPVLITLYNNQTLLTFVDPISNPSVPIYIYFQLTQNSWTNGYWFSVGALMLVIGFLFLALGGPFLLFLLIARREKFNADVQKLIDAAF